MVNPIWQWSMYRSSITKSAVPPCIFHIKKTKCLHSRRTCDIVHITHHYTPFITEVSRHFYEFLQMNLCLLTVIIQINSKRFSVLYTIRIDCVIVACQMTAYNG